MWDAQITSNVMLHLRLSGKSACSYDSRAVGPAVQCSVLGGLAGAVAVAAAWSPMSCWHQQKKKKTIPGPGSAALGVQRELVWWMSCITCGTHKLHTAVASSLLSSCWSQRAAQPAARPAAPASVQQRQPCWTALLQEQLQLQVLP